MKKVIILLLLAISRFCFAQENFTMSDLVFPPGVSYTLGTVTLTRVLENTTASSRQGQTNTGVQSETASQRQSTATSDGTSRGSNLSAGAHVGATIGGSTGGSGGFKLSNLFGVSVDAGGNVSADYSKSKTHSEQSLSETASESTRGRTNEEIKANEEFDQYGHYRLDFTISFKNNDFNDSFLVGGKTEDGSGPSVILNGLSRQIRVPYQEREEAVRLGDEECVFFFNYLVEDQLILKDLKTFEARGNRNAVTLSLNGNDFPVISERTKENVISKNAGLINRNPNTVISVQFGEAKSLSPWRVKQKYPRVSGKIGEYVTVRDALDAINEVVTNCSETILQAFTINEQGNLSAIADTPAVDISRKGDVFITAVAYTENSYDREENVRMPTKEFLSRKLSDFSELNFVQIPLQDVAELDLVIPQEVAPLVKDIEATLSADALAIWNKLRADLLSKEGVQLWENGPYWAFCNVGAKMPHESGYYFWWGDTVGYKQEGYKWNAANGSIQGFYFSEENCPTFGKSISELQKLGYIDNTGNLVPAHDAATAHLGAPWRLPTSAEIEALCQNCDTIWAKQNGVYGRLVKGRGKYALKSIFLPAAGFGLDSNLYNLGSLGRYWSSTPNSDVSDYAWYLSFTSDNFSRYDNRRDIGYSVRPVRGFAK